MGTSDYTQTIFDSIAQHRDELHDLNYNIYNNPEVAWTEHRAHDNCVALLTKLGFKVQPHAYGIPTSFEAEYSVGTGGRTVVFNAEYDSLPGIGHACGHNLICTASFAAFVAAAKQLELSQVPGCVRLLGTPAEEKGGGKAALISRGAYKSTDACLLAHPGPHNRGYEEPFNGIVHVQHTAITIFTATFKGKNAHAAVSPWEGRNALDGAVITYNSLSMLRQQTAPDCRIHAIITEGGIRCNIIPDRATLELCVRAPTIHRMQELKARVVECAESAGRAAACEVEIVEEMIYADLPSNPTVCQVFTEECAKNDVPMAFDINTPLSAGSTDMGNVSYVVPAFQATFGIPTKPGGMAHTPDFCQSAGLEVAFENTMKVAAGLAGAAWRIISDDEVANQMKSEFAEAESIRRKFMSAEDEWKVITTWSGLPGSTDTEPHGKADSCLCEHFN